MWMWDGWGWMALGIIWMLVFWGGIIALIVWAVTRLTRSRPSERGDLMEIARTRYARGEITKEQFEQIKKDLSEH